MHPEDSAGLKNNLNCDQTSPESAQFALTCLNLYDFMVISELHIRGGIGDNSKIIGRTHGTPYHGYGYIPPRFGGNVVRRMGTQQQFKDNFSYFATKTYIVTPH